MNAYRFETKNQKNEIVNTRYVLIFEDGKTIQIHDSCINVMDANNCLDMNKAERININEFSEALCRVLKRFRILELL